MPKRTYSREFKESAVELVYEQGYAPGEAAKSLGVERATLRYWPCSSGARRDRCCITATGACSTPATSIRHSWPATTSSAA